MTVRLKGSFIYQFRIIMVKIPFLLGILLASCHSSVSIGVTLDVETHNVLIEQLESVLSQLDVKDPSYVPSTLRVCDLLLDRARLNDMISIEKAQKDSEQSKQDREKVISLLKKIEPLLNKDQKILSYIQVAQTEQLLGNTKKSEKTLTKVLKIANESYVHYWTALDILADLQFQKGNYKKAYELYTKSARSTHGTDFTKYRLAWCEYYFGNLKKAIKQLEELLNNDQLEISLRREMTRDLVILYANDDFSVEKINKIKTYASKISKHESEKVSEKSSEKAFENTSENEFEVHMKLYASELKRLGKKKESAIVLLNHIRSSKENQSSNAKDKINTADELDSKVELFENLVHIGKLDEAVEVLRTVVAQDCQALCNDIMLKINKCFKSWMEEEKTRPSDHLFLGLLLLTQMKSSYEKGKTPAPLYAGVNLAQESNHHEKAVQILPWMIANEKDPVMKENLLKAYIVSSEKLVQSKPSNISEQEFFKIQQDSYLLYLQMGNNPEIKLDVYQSLVELNLNKKNWTEAEKYAIELYEKTKQKFANRKAKETSIAKSLLIKSGDQIIFIYSQMNSVEKEKHWSKKLYNDLRSEKYIKNYSRLSAKEIKLKIDKKSSNYADANELLLLSDQSKNATEKYLLLNDAFLVAMQINDISLMKKISVRISKIVHKLKSPEKNLAIEKIVYVADQENNYLQSLYWEKKMESNNSSFLSKNDSSVHERREQERKFRWAVKGRLAKRPERKLEYEILESSKFSIEQKKWILERIAIEDKKPINSFSKFIRVIKFDPTYENRIILALYYYSDSIEVKKFIKQHNIRSSNIVVKLIQRDESFEEINKSIKKYSKLKMSGKKFNDYTRYVGNKAKFIQDFERTQILKNRDDMASSVARQLWIIWNESFVKEIVGLSHQINIPKNLKEEFTSKINQKIQHLEKAISLEKQKSFNAFNPTFWSNQLNGAIANGASIHRKAILKHVKMWSQRTAPYFVKEWNELANNIFPTIEEKIELKNFNKLSQFKHSQGGHL